jgi:hypothetical protein
MPGVNQTAALIKGGRTDFIIIIIIIIITGVPPHSLIQYQGFTVERKNTKTKQTNGL